MDREKRVSDDITRRDFLKFCSAIGLAIGLGPSAGSRVLGALTAANRPPVIWLHFAECTGCTEAVLRTVNPQIDDLILGAISLDYHETLMAGAGSTVHNILTTGAETYRGQFICVVEGAIPTAQDGNYGMINGRTMLSIAQEICPKAKGIIAIGSCSSFGGLPAAAPNPTGAKNVLAALKSLTLPPVINVPGCPPNPVSFVGVITNFILRGAFPPTDNYLRPLFAYGTKVHLQCPFINDTGPTGRCQRKKGCKGPNTYNNCPTVKFNNAANFPMNAGHVCIGCSEPSFWDINTPFWGLLANNAAIPPSPDVLFEHHVPPIAVLRGRQKLHATMHREKNPHWFDLRGRRIIPANGHAAMPKTPGMYVKKTKNPVNRTFVIEQ